jgi:hypothetical protein
VSLADVDLLRALTADCARKRGARVGDEADEDGYGWEELAWREGVAGPDAAEEAAGAGEGEDEAGEGEPGQARRASLSALQMWFLHRVKQTEYFYTRISHLVKEIRSQFTISTAFRNKLYLKQREAFAKHKELAEQLRPHVAGSPLADVRPGMLWGALPGLADALAGPIAASATAGGAKDAAVTSNVGLSSVLSVLLGHSLPPDLARPALHPPPGEQPAAPSTAPAKQAAASPSPMEPLAALSRHWVAAHRGAPRVLLCEAVFHKWIASVCELHVKKTTSALPEGIYGPPADPHAPAVRSDAPVPSSSPASRMPKHSTPSPDAAPAPAPSDVPPRPHASLCGDALAHRLAASAARLAQSLAEGAAAAQLSRGGAGSGLGAGTDVGAFTPALPSSPCVDALACSLAHDPVRRPYGTAAALDAPHAHLHGPATAASPQQAPGPESRPSVSHMPRGLRQQATASARAASAPAAAVAAGCSACELAGRRRVEAVAAVGTVLSMFDADAPADTVMQLHNLKQCAGPEAYADIPRTYRPCQGCYMATAALPAYRRPFAALPQSSSASFASLGAGVVDVLVSGLSGLDYTHGCLYTNKSAHHLTIAAQTVAGARADPHAADLQFRVQSSVPSQRVSVWDLSHLAAAHNVVALQSIVRAAGRVVDRDALRDDRRNKVLRQSAAFRGLKARDERRPLLQSEHRRPAPPEGQRAQTDPKPQWGCVAECVCGGCAAAGEEMRAAMGGVELFLN